MTQPIAIALYVVFCVLAGICGSYRRMGFFGTFLLSLIITPVVMLLVLILTVPLNGVEEDQRSQPQARGWRGAMHHWANKIRR
jgi:uncharacterized membrane protein